MAESESLAGLVLQFSLISNKFGVKDFNFFASISHGICCC